MSDRLSALTHRDAPWAGLRVLVTGLGVSGLAAADALLERGAHVLVVDGAEPSGVLAERAGILDILGAELALGPDAVSRMPSTPLDLVVTSLWLMAVPRPSPLNFLSGGVHTGGVVVDSSGGRSRCVAVSSSTRPLDC